MEYTQAFQWRGWNAYPPSLLSHTNRQDFETAKCFSLTCFALTSINEGLWSVILGRGVQRKAHFWFPLQEQASTAVLIWWRMRNRLITSAISIVNAKTEGRPGSCSVAVCEEQRRHCLKKILVQSSQAFTRSIGKMFVSLLHRGNCKKHLDEWGSVVCPVHWQNLRRKQKMKCFRPTSANLQFVVVKLTNPNLSFEFFLSISKLDLEPAALWLSFSVTSLLPPRYCLFSGVVS